MWASTEERAPYGILLTVHQCRTRPSDPRCGFPFAIKGLHASQTTYPDAAALAEARLFVKG